MLKASPNARDGWAGLAVPEGSPVSSNRTGLFMIRAWVEAGSSSPLRATVRISSDIEHGIERTVNLCRPDEVLALVDQWLQQFTDDD
jgi:hypothetical protein